MLSQEQLDEFRKGWNEGWYDGRNFGLVAGFVVGAAGLLAVLLLGKYLL